MRGQIQRVISGFYDVNSNGKTFRVRGSGNLRNTNQSPLVGDFVIFDEDGFLTSIESRRNSLIRPKVANVDQVVIVASLKSPDYSSLLLNKFLAIVEFSNIEPIIVFTKTDLTNINPIDEFKNQGYRVFAISNNDINSLVGLSKIFKDKLTVFTGQTGAGKSSTIENISGEKRETQEISKALGRGKHTTRVVEIIPFNGGGLIDTPGFSSLELDLTKLELAQSYKDFRKLAESCKFRNCIHVYEKDCAVIDALNNKKISQQRYDDYLKLLEEAK